MPPSGTVVKKLAVSLTRLAARLSDSGPVIAMGNGVLVDEGGQERTSYGERRDQGRADPFGAGTPFDEIELDPVGHLLHGPDEGDELRWRRRRRRRSPRGTQCGPTR